jgi:hypothetical protein
LILSLDTEALDGKDNLNVQNSIENIQPFLNTDIVDWLIS